MKNSKIVLVTGASSGIGKSIAFQLIKDGHRVYTAARRISQMDDIQQAGGKPLAMDITKESDLQHVVQTVIGEQGTIDVLINNAGYAIYGAVEDVGLDEARRQFDVNMFGLARLTQLVLPYLREKKAGTIINMSSMGGKVYTPLGAWYHASKHALEGWSDCLRLELKPYNINVVIIEPGIIKTEFGEVMYGPLESYAQSGPYAKMSKDLLASSEKTYRKFGAGPEIIARVVSKAINSRRPKTRYAAGPLASLSIQARRILSDRMFDRMIAVMS
jgi:short-subunit dehydrogenase